MNDLHLNRLCLKLIQAEFENKLREHGYAYLRNKDGQYILNLNNFPGNALTAKLILSEPIDIVILGSRNNTEITGIGLFRLQFPKEAHEQDFFILAFHSTNNKCTEFIIIPPEELKGRLIASNRSVDDDRKVEIVFWLMPDDQLYDTTGMGAEAEWYFLSKGLHGRMADNSTWDYSMYLNDWSRLMKA